MIKIFYYFDTVRKIEKNSLQLFSWTNFFHSSLILKHTDILEKFERI